MAFMVRRKPTKSTKRNCTTTTLFFQFPDGDLHLDTHTLKHSDFYGYFNTRASTGWYRAQRRAVTPPAGGSLRGRAGPGRASETGGGQRGAAPLGVVLPWARLRPCLGTRRDGAPLGAGSTGLSPASTRQPPRRALVRRPWAPRL